MIQLMFPRSLVAYCLLVSVAQAEAPLASVTTLSAVTDRPAAIYKVGETVTFRLAGPAGSEVKCVLSKDGFQPQPEQRVNLAADGTGTITGKLAQPGFLSLRVLAGKASALAGAAVSPLKIAPSMPVPDDFDAFWDAQKAALKKVPAKAALVPVKSPVKDVDAFDIKVDCIGNPVSGYYAKPHGAKPKSLPAILTVHGAGVSSSNLGVAGWAGRDGGMLALDINAHGIENGKPADFYKALGAGSLLNYRTAGNKDRETVYFKGMFLRLIRAIDFLTSQPEWNGERLVVYGSSQGGFQAIAAAGLDSRVTFICAGVPAGCDHTGFMVNRICGWPKLVGYDAQGKPVPEMQKAARYFDCVNFATRARCKGAVFTVGFIDGTCPPTSVFAAYNALTIPKKIHHDVMAGHTNTPAATKFMQDAAIKHLRGDD